MRTSSLSAARAAGTSGSMGARAPDTSTPAKSATRATRRARRRMAMEYGGRQANGAGSRVGTLGSVNRHPGGGAGIRLRDTLRRAVVPLEPLELGRVRMYSCGPTVYRYAHIGNLRTFLLADLIRRVL